MRRHLFRAVSALFLTTLLSGCYVNLTAPAPDMSVKMDASGAAKLGQSTCQQVLWVFAFGDCSIDAAMKSGGITKVNHVDSHMQMVLWGAWSRLTIKAYGE